MKSFSERVNSYDPKFAATHVDEFEALTLTSEIIAYQQPGLTPEEQFDLALETAHSFQVLENLRADRALLAQRVDDAFRD